MANIFPVNVYQINQRLVDGSVQSIRYGFPSTGVTILDVSNSPRRSLASGYNVYGLILVAGNSAAASSAPNEYYVQETFAQLITLIG